MKKRILSIILAAALCVGLLPAPAFAAPAIGSGGTIDVSTDQAGINTIFGAGNATLDTNTNTITLTTDVTVNATVTFTGGDWTLNLGSFKLKGADGANGTAGTNGDPNADSVEKAHGTNGAAGGDGVCPVTVSGGTLTITVASVSALQGGNGGNGGQGGDAGGYYDGMGTEVGNRGVGGNAGKGGAGLTVQGGTVKVVEDMTITGGNSGNGGYYGAAYSETLRYEGGSKQDGGNALLVTNGMVEIAPTATVTLTGGTGSAIGKGNSAAGNKLKVEGQGIVVSPNEINSVSAAATVSLNNYFGLGTGKNGFAHIGDSSRNLPTPPEQSGYKFEGWYEDDQFNTPVTSEATVVADKTYFAKWRSVSTAAEMTKVKVGGTAGVYKDEGGTKTFTVTVPYGTSLKAIAPTIEVSTGASYSPEGEQDFSNGAVEYTVTAEDTTTTAKYKIEIVNAAPTYTPSAPSYSYYTITASAGAGGSISPTGSVSVREGRDKTFAITSDSGYLISDVLVDGESVGAVSEYTFKNVQKRHTIEAVFAKENPNTGVGNPFTDVKESDWFFGDVMFVYDKEIMVGTSDTTFSPGQTTSRAMIATILWRQAGSPVVDYLMDFSDVDPSAWYGEAVRWAASEGIVSGYGNGKFGSNDPITREQLATILYNYEKKQGGSVSAFANLSGFADADTVSGYAQDALRWAVSEGIISGTSSTTLSPQGQATRAQTAAMLHRFMNN